MKPVTLNAIAALLKFPVTYIVLLAWMEQVPTKSMNELQLRVCGMKLLARLSLSLAGARAESVGLKLICNEVGYP